MAAAAAFFALPVEQKQRIAVSRDQRGWMATGMATMPGAAEHDLKEVFFWGRELAADDPDLLAGKALLAMNKWPDDTLPQLRRELLPYYHAVCQLGTALLQAVALALGAPDDFFSSRYRAPLARGQLVYYPPAESGVQHSQFGVAPHSDFGVLTLLLQDDNGGLRVQTRDGDWLDAPPLPGTLVCNIGDLLQRWSNDRLLSTRHAVINRSGRARYSIPVFFDPDSDALVDPQTLDPTAEPRYPPVSAGDYISGRNRAAFAQYR